MRAKIGTFMLFGPLVVGLFYALWAVPETRAPLLIWAAGIAWITLASWLVDS